MCHLFENRKKCNMCFNVDTKILGSNVDFPFNFTEPDTVQQPIEVLRPNKDNDEVANPPPNPDPTEAVQVEGEHFV